MVSGKGDTDQGVERAGGEMPSDCMWGRARSVPRPDGAVPYRRSLAGHQLLVHGRLRRSRVLQRGDSHIACCA